MHPPVVVLFACFIFPPFLLILFCLFFPLYCFFYILPLSFSSQCPIYLLILPSLNPQKPSLLVVPVNGHVDLKANLTPPMITHTAATPMPIPKLPVGADPILGYEARGSSNVSIDPASCDKSPVGIFIFAYTKKLVLFFKRNNPLPGFQSQH